MFREKILVLSLFSIYCLSSAGKNKSFSALFAFGDSILDTGNNNRLLTLLKANYWPYGLKYDFKIPTGRFSSGRVFTDVVAEGLGIKRIVPAYRRMRRIKPDDLKTGVCFASGGSGIDDLTSGLHRVLSTEDQVRDFKKYLKQLKNETKKKKEMKDIISNAVFLVSRGNNDIGYFVSPARYMRLQSKDKYTSNLVFWTKTFLQDLYDLGARKFAVMGVLPAGCLPLHRFLFGEGFAWCNFIMNRLSVNFNTKLQIALIGYGVEESFKGFKEVKRSCCCMVNSIIPCRNPDEYVFYDFLHPTTKAYEVISKPLVHQMRKGLA
ncbi:GDSL esterase/lipase EXL6-like isoform X2 [Raphanus sativus]|uniref:GDSL esterase/lipase EXL6-like isoform X2 n=1 Tax=Raphanus sativus TaxID=3726 RepID=A0A9W3CFS2_RAPSA|nr:GDSL esterase/lipase EXL6-like isoform X2 [Raphanus sativus]